MTSPASLADDLSFIRRAVHRAQTPDVAGIYFLWAAILGLGTALQDLSPTIIPWFWLAAGPIGLATSAYIGYAASRRTGQADRAEGMRHIMHWASLLVVTGLGAVGVARGAIDGQSFSRYVALLVAYAYFSAAIHLQKNLVWLGVSACVVFALMIFDVSHAGLIGGGLFALTAIVIGLGATRQPRG